MWHGDTSYNRHMEFYVFGTEFYIKLDSSVKRKNSIELFLVLLEKKVF